MDKQGKTITIKINGKDRPLKEEKLNHPKEDTELKMNLLETDEVDSWVFPKGRDEAINETAAAQEQEEESFEWILPEHVEEEAVKEYTVAPKQANKQKNLKTQKKKSLGISVWNHKIQQNNRLYTTIFLTVLFAILLGTAFGVTILKFVKADTESTADVSTTAKTPSAAEKPAAGSPSVQLNSIPAFVIQNGIFTTADAAKDRVDLLSGKGIAADIFLANGKFAVYIGIGGSIEEAKQKSETLKAKGVEVFAKPIEISGGKSASLPADEAKFLAQAPEIYGILSSETTAAPEAIKKVEDYQALINKMTDKNVKDKNVLKAKASMERASAAFIDYQKTKDANKLAEMQNELLAFLSAYQTIGN